MKILPSNLFSTFELIEVVKVKNYELVKKIEVLDTKTLDRYRNQTMFEIARKACFIFLCNPIVLVMKISFNVLQMGFDFVKVTIDSTIDMAVALKNKEIIKVIEIYAISRIDFIQYVAQDIVYIIRAPFFALALQFATLFTLISPNRARKAIAKIERSWNYNMGVSYDYRNNPDFKEKSLFRAFFETLLNRNESVVFYLAPCFQPGSLKDKHVIFPLVENIKK
ncbi:MAG: hypothetical protein K1060chlam1_01525 [Candidatus Anoxychlamydiales bacterium]|nr:hypothetical protein [Candidatus Anoxychlamydiales bacterium]